MKRSLALAAVAVTATVTAASGSATTSQGAIVFSADRAPSVSGEIYRLDPSGRRVDLSRSPYRDANPVVSPDGKRVAFVSDRIPKGAVYEVGIGGHGLHRVSPQSRFGFDSSTALAWQPHGKRLAAMTTASGLWILQPGHKTVRVRGVSGLAAAQPWSPDGRLLLTGTHGHSTTAVTPRGREAWAVPAAGAAAWSEQGLLAITDKKGSVVDVYDESGHLRFKARVGAHYGTPSWSPDGSRLAVLAWPRLREWTSNGELVLDRHVSTTTSIAWDALQRLIVVNHYHSRWLDPRSADGRLAIVTRKHGSGFTLGAAPVHGGRAKTYARIPGCWSDGNVWAAAAGPLQFAGRSIVYESRGYCDEPFSNLYSVAPDGSGPRRITNVQAQETQPALSPDGSEIAYVWAKFTGLSCAGCSDGIRIAGAGGQALRVLTNPENCTFDDSPTWSPDGSTILFSESGCDSPAELYTVPAAGGAVRDLGAAGAQPAWGPSRIAYVARGVWTANPDGTDAVRVGKGSHPAWSADGRLAYLTGRSGTTVVVGSTQSQLPFVSVSSLAWSPDGTRFVVTARASGAAAPDVYTVRTDGTDPIRLTTNYDALNSAWG